MKISTSFLGLLVMATSYTEAFPSLVKREGDGDIKVGEYRPAGDGDKRSPCPALNALANHGYLPRDGRNIDQETFVSVILEHLGLAPELTSILAGSALKVNKEETDTSVGIIWNWFGISKSIFGVRRDGQLHPDTKKPVIDLDQLNRHGAIEHDISLSRLDKAQGDNHAIQPELVEQMLNMSEDGEFVTQNEFAKLRRLRYSQQKEWYKQHGKEDELTYGPREEFLAFGEAGLIQGILGWKNKFQSYRVPVSYLKAFFAEERLPIEEGWTPRKDSPMGIIEGNLIVAAIKLKAGIFS